MTRLIHVLAERTRLQQEAATGPSAHGLPPFDPGALMFARAVYLITASNANELALTENEIVAITGKLDPRKGAEVDSCMKVEGEWWKRHMREGRAVFSQKHGSRCWRGARRRSQRN